MRSDLKYLILLIALPFCSLAQDKNEKTPNERLEIVGKWSSFTSMDSTKIEVVEFRPDGNLVEYRNGQPKHSKAQYILYNDELTIKEGKTEKEPFMVKFKVKRISQGLLLETTGLNTGDKEKFIWVKLFPWKP